MGSLEISTRTQREALIEKERGTLKESRWGFEVDKKERKKEKSTNC